jgi:hypothetical protein
MKSKRSCSSDACVVAIALHSDATSAKCNGKEEGILCLRETDSHTVRKLERNQNASRQRAEGYESIEVAC